MMDVEKIRSVVDRLHTILHDKGGEGMYSWWVAIEKLVAELNQEFFLTEPAVHPVLKEWLDACKAQGVDNATQVNYRRLFERAFEAGQKAGTK